MAEVSGTSNDEKVTPTMRDNHLHADQYGTKLVDHAEKWQQKAQHVAGHDPEKQKGPAGGFDSTPIPQAPPGYTIKITFHSARNLPFADLSLTSDPYIHAILKTDLQKRHKHDPDLRLRTPTVHRNTNPEWNVSWTIAHVPASGFKMKCRLYDEDPQDHDDRLGNVHVDVDKIDDNWKGFKEQAFKVKKRMGSKRAYTLRGCISLLNRNVKMDGEVIVSVENLGQSKGDNGGQPYTVGPLPWTKHHSPLIGMIAGTKESHGAKGGKKSERYNFQAIQMQLEGPVPEPLYHRYVEFKPFVAGMFTSHTLKGRLLNHALHHQHARIYNFDETTTYGVFDKPSSEMTSQFLEFVRYDQGGRIFTYVITLDGQFRFTETGKEFGIDMLSKHSMHSDVSIYIAFSGEFFIRRLKHPRQVKGSNPDPATETMPPAMDPEAEEQQKKKEETEHSSPTASSPKSPPGSPGSSARPQLTVSSNEQSQSGQTSKQRSFSLFKRGNSNQQSVQSHTSQTHAGEDPPKDASHYELIIDNDSGTYRPNAKYLSQLKKFLQHNFPGLRVATLDCQGDEEKMKKLKGEQRERKKKSGEQIMYMQNSSVESFSSSDEEKLERRVNATGTKTPGGTLKKKAQQAKSKIIGGDFEESGDDDKPGKTDRGVKAIGKEDGPKNEKEAEKETEKESEGVVEADSSAAANRSHAKQDHTQSTSNEAVHAAGAATTATPAATAATASAAEAEKSTVSQPTTTATTTSSRPGTAALNKDNLEQHDHINALAFNPNTNFNQHSHPHSHTARKPSMSTEADRMSFNTAFTDAEQTTDHFVTPKPSLGDGGLRQFRDHADDTHQTPGQTTPRAAGKTTTGSGTRGDVTPTANGQATSPALVHDIVTSSSYIGGGL